ncbi:MAG: hypothetical protein ACI4QT_05425 [Kiritimatiellia bacterium]
MSFVNFLLKVLLFFVFAALAVFIANEGMKMWDERYNPFVKPGAIVFTAGKAQDGMNRRLFREIRFPATGLKILLRCENLTSEEIQSVPDFIHGEVRLYALSDVEAAAPGPEPHESARKILSYPFTLLPSETLSSSTSERVSFAERLAVATATIDVKPIEHFDVSYSLVPKDSHSGKTEDGKTLSELLFPVGEPYEIDIVLNGYIPQGAKLALSYSRPVRKLF